MNGWKEIANHFGKGVRTVQRWEQEANLPVHRLPGPRGDTVFAFTSELRAWMESIERRPPNGLAETGVDSGEAKAAKMVVAGTGVDSGEAKAAKMVVADLRRHWFRAPWVLACGGSVAVVALVFIAIWFLPRAADPVRAEVRGDTLVAYDATGEVIWSHRFEEGLQDLAYASPVSVAVYSAFADIDHDDRVETLFLAIPPGARASALYCFDADGSIRFRHVPDYRHRFGAEIYTSPWLGRAILDDKATLRSGEIWVTWNHAVEYPTVLEKMDASGRVIGQFWNAGFITAIAPVVRDGRRVMLIGGVNNDAKCAMLAELDAERPSGTSPALKPAYECVDCPPGHPPRYVLFPRLDSDDVDFLPNVIRLEPDAAGQTMVGVVHNPAAAVYYRLDKNFKLLRSEWGAEYRAVRRKLEEQGRLRLLARAEDAYHPPCLRVWDGRAFAAVPIRLTP